MAANKYGHLTRICRFWLCIALLLYTVNGLAQISPDNRKASLHVDNVPLSVALTQLEASSGLHFAFGHHRLPLDSLVSYQGSDQPVSVIIRAIFGKTPVTIRMVENQWVIAPEGEASPPGQETEKTLYTLSGYLRNQANGEALIGATIVDPASGKGAISNTYGFYSLTLPQGSYTLQISYLGYLTRTLPVTLVRHLSFNIGLTENNTAIEEITISTDTLGRLIHQSRLGMNQIRPRQVEEMPAFMSEPDVIKSLYGLPGVHTLGDGSTSFFVRGGNRDQNLILIDDAPVFNPSHLLGMFSSFYPEAVNSIEVYRGDFPANYGGRLSSVVDIHLREGNKERFAGESSLGLISTRLSLEGPLAKEKSSFFVAGRASHIKWLLAGSNADDNSLFFYDYSAKFNVKAGRRHRFFVSWYNGRDEFTETNDGNTSGLAWQNFVATLRWTYHISERLFANTSLYGSSYEYFLFINKSADHYWKSGVGMIGIKSDLAWYLAPGLTVKTGFNQGFFAFNPGNYYLHGQLTDEDYVQETSSNEGAIYLGTEHSFGIFRAWYGARLVQWKNYGPADIYVFDNQYRLADTLRYADDEISYKRTALEPRIGLLCQTGANTSIKIAFTRTNQHYQLVSNSISPLTSLEVWMPSSPNLPAQTANILMAGIGKLFPQAATTLNAEVYYKKMFNLTEPTDHANLVLNPLIEQELRNGYAEAYGFELMATHRKNRWETQASYSFSRVFRTTSTINKDEAYPAIYDIPHDFQLNLTYTPTPRWLLSASWNYASGATFTSPASFYYYQNRQVPYYDQRNNDRLPDYHRLDLNARWQINQREQAFKHYIEVCIFNAYNHHNPISVNFNKTTTDDGSLIIPSDYSQPVSIQPSVVYLFGIMPSIAYLCRF